MNVNELLERAKRQLNAGQPDPHVWPESEIDLAACVMQAISAMAHDVMRSDGLRGWLQQKYPVALDASGVGDLLAAVGDITGVAGEILIEGIRYGAVVDADNNILQPLAHYAQFIAPQSTVFAYYTLKDRKIHTRAINIPVNSPADIQGVTGPLIITASFAPQSVTHVPPELEENLVHSLVRIVALKTYTDAKSPKTNAYA